MEEQSGIAKKGSYSSQDKDKVGNSTSKGKRKGKGKEKEMEIEPFLKPQAQELTSSGLEVWMTRGRFLD